jgi:AsmA protein
MTGIIKQGILRSDDLMLLSPLVQVNGQGSVDLVEETIDYVLIPVLVGKLETQDGQELQELRGVSIPVAISGDLHEPDYDFDIVTGMQMTVSDEDKAEIFNALLDKVLGNKKDKD